MALPEIAVPLRGTRGVGDEIHGLIRRLYPECRSITGDAVRRSLETLREFIPLEVREVPSGTKAFDWTVPREWNIRDAWVRGPDGRKVVDFRDSNLHVVSYSVPVHERMPLEALKTRLFTLPEHPDWIPYRTSYYQQDWGFCLAHNRYAGLPEGEYEVFIDSTLEDGALTYGEYLVRGQTDDEVLVSTHICHPSMANDNLSGIAVATMLASRLEPQSLRYSYRFLFTPGTIGSIVWLSRNESETVRIRHGLVLACLGDAGDPTYKKSRRGDAEIDRAVRQALKDSGDPYQIIGFSPYGYDERQFCSPGFNLPVGCLTRSSYGQFPEYHTSADDPDFVTPRHLEASFESVASTIRILEDNRRYLNQNPKCEPQLGRRGLYGPVGGVSQSRTGQMALLWVLSLSDGDHTLLDIAEASDLPFAAVAAAASDLCESSLLRPVEGDGQRGPARVHTPRAAGT